MNLTNFLLLVACALLAIVCYLLSRARKSFDDVQKQFRQQILASRTRQSRSRQLHAVRGEAKPEIERARVTRRDADDLPRTGRQRSGLRFEMRGGEHDGLGDDDRLDESPRS